MVTQHHKPLANSRSSLIDIALVFGGVSINNLLLFFVFCFFSPSSHLFYAFLTIFSMLLDLDLHMMLTSLGGVGWGGANTTPDSCYAT